MKFEANTATAIRGLLAQRNIAFAASLAAIRAQVSAVVLMQVLETFRAEALNAGLIQAVAFLRQNEMLVMKNHVREVACQNEFLSSLASQSVRARSLKVVQTPSDPQDLGDIG